MQKNNRFDDTKGRLASSIVMVIFGLAVASGQAGLYLGRTPAILLLILLALGAVTFVLLRLKRRAAPPRDTDGTNQHAQPPAMYDRNAAESAPTRAERRLRDPAAQQMGESRGSTPEGYVDYYEYRDAETHGTTPEGEYRPQRSEHACGYERDEAGRAADGCISHGTTPEGEFHDRRRKRQPEGPEF